jgi:DNA-binding beta-propeller fold protein YncE
MFHQTGSRTAPLTRGSALVAGFVLPMLVLGMTVAVAPGMAAAGTLVVANKAEDTLSLIDLESGEVRATLPTGVGPHEVAVSPDGTRALVADYGRQTPGATLTLVDIPSAEVVATIDLGEYRRPHGILWLDATRAVVTAEANQALLVVDVSQRAVAGAVSTGQQVSHMVALTPAGDRAFVANIGSGSVTAVNLEAMEKIADVATGEGAEGVTVAAGGAQVWITNRAADTVTVLDARTLEPVAQLESEGFPIRAEATPDGSRVLVTNARAGDLAVFDTRELTLERRVPLPVAGGDVEGRLFGGAFGDSSVPIGVVVDPTGTRAWIAHAHGDVISELDLESWQVRRHLRAGKEPDGMAYSPVRVAAPAPSVAPDAEGQEPTQAPPDAPRQ